MKTANQLSEELLLTVKKQQHTGVVIDNISKISLNQLYTELRGDKQKKAFWINCYNAFFQILRKEKNLIRPKIYTEQLITIANNKFSLDDIEHGILRRYRLKISMGYLPNLFASGLIKKLAVSELDYRIHFALNCGAKSCPPIAFYTNQNLDQQLELATRSFLESETKVFKDTKEIHITKLFQWYLADFGGKRGIQKILQD